MFESLIDTFASVTVVDLTDEDWAELTRVHAGKHPDFLFQQGGKETSWDISKRLVDYVFKDSETQGWRATISKDDRFHGYIFSTYYTDGSNKEALLSMWSCELRSGAMESKLDKALLEKATKTAREKGIARLWFGSREADGKSAETLTKRGFVQVEGSEVPESVKKVIQDRVPFRKIIR